MNTRSVTVTLNDGGNEGDSGGAKSVSISPASANTFTLVGINDLPTLTGLEINHAGTYIQNGTPLVIDSDAVLSDFDLEAASSSGNWNGSTLEIAVKANSSVILNNSTGTVVVAQPTDTAIAFGGSGYLEANSTSLANTAEFTISFWLNPNALSGYQSLVGQNNAIEMLTNNNQIYLWTNNTGGFTFDTSSVLSAGTWTHIAVTGNASTGAMKMYANGNLLQTWNHGSVTAGHYGNYSRLFEFDVAIGSRLILMLMLELVVAKPPLP
jgi:hypothetical protein